MERQEQIWSQGSIISGEVKGKDRLKSVSLTALPDSIVLRLHKCAVSSGAVCSFYPGSHLLMFSPEFFTPLRFILFSLRESEVIFIMNANKWLSVAAYCIVKKDTEGLERCLSS